MLLSCVGLYGVLAGEVTSGTREIGLRLALGASRGKVLRNTIITGLSLTGLGLVVGSALSFLGSRLLVSQLYGVRPTDLLTWVSTAATLVLVGLTASYFPARRASKIEPMEALKAE